MNTRALTQAEQANLSAVKSAGVPTVLLFVTATGLRKSILDATLPLRTLLAEEQIHDFSKQAQGPANKRIIQGKILLDSRSVDVGVSLYRPVTKQGDPRLWPGNFSRYSNPDDVFVVFVANRHVCFVNLSQSYVAEAKRLDIRTVTTDFITTICRKTSAVSVELLSKFRALAANGPLAALGSGDTSVGLTIETALGIKRNSARKPDYKGIEIKAKRWGLGRVRNRYTLFACVPDWVLSPCKSSAEILARYGYQSGSAHKLYCTVSAAKRNSQGLQFHVDSDIGRLVEYAWRVSSGRQGVAVWELARLHRYFGDKHGETFWVHVTPVVARNARAFKLTEIIHTRGPSYPQFDHFLEKGVVTMDHLIKRTGTKVVEKGPLFKVAPDRLGELFVGEPEKFRLA